MILGDNIEKVAKEEIRLILAYAVDALGEALVDIDGLPAGHR